MHQTQQHLPERATQRNLISYSLRRDEDGPRVTWVAVFDYPDCTREFDGHGWTVTPKPAQ